MSNPEIPFLPSDRDASGRTLGPEELELLEELIGHGNLFCVPGLMVPRFEVELCQLFGTEHARAVSSGTAAVHTALAALDVAPGQEVITSPITDMGGISPIMFQGALPVFADVDPDTLNVTAKTIAPRITERTSAIIVTHLFGNPCDMDPILDLAARHGLPVIEDAAQAYLATYGGELVGTLGELSTFSMQQGKHMTCGEGGFVLTNSDTLARRARVWADKGWNYAPEDPDHEFMGLNYRMTELQGAVALAQLRKLKAMTRQRVATAGMLCEQLETIPGIRPIPTTPGATQTYWRVGLLVDEDEIGVGPDEIGDALMRVKIWNKPGYIRRPAFMCAQFRERRTFGDTEYPYSVHPGPTELENIEDYPGCVEGLRKVLVLPWTERHQEEHVKYIADSIGQAVASARKSVHSG
jgi:dTDP-4-amino-4,6-dideoxygalactose transaminase